MEHCKPRKLISGESCPSEYSVCSIFLCIQVELNRPYIYTSPSLNPLSLGRLLIAHTHARYSRRWQTWGRYMPLPCHKSRLVCHYCTTTLFLTSHRLTSAVTPINLLFSCRGSLQCFICSKQTERWLESKL